MNTIRPVVAGRRWFAVSIVCENQSILRPAVVGNRKIDLVAAVGWVRKRDIQSVRRSIEPDRRIIDLDGIDRHIAEIQIDPGDAVLQNFHVNLCTRGFNLRKLIVKDEVDVVVDWPPLVNRALTALSTRQRQTRENQCRCQQKSTGIHAVS